LRFGQGVRELCPDKETDRQTKRDNYMSQQVACVLKEYHEKGERDCKGKGV